MKSILSILLATIIFAISAKDFIAVLNFRINQDFIAKNLCINREKPKTKCHGKCQLSLQLEKSHDKEQTPVMPDQEVKISLIQAETAFFADYELLNKQAVSTYHHLRTQCPPGQLFRPPESYLLT